MNRCSKCLLPDSLPGSNFNHANECIWCQTGYPSYSPKGELKLKSVLEAIPRNPNGADCIVGLSGGKDSTYALYRMVKHYGLKAEAFTYIHDGSTAFSVENAKRVCSELNVKHHIVSLRNQEHLKSFRSYFNAWLANPTTVSAGMTCVACKHLHLLGLDIAKRNGIPMIIWSSSPLEYSPFLAIKHVSGKKNQFQREGKIKSGIQLVKEMAQSPLFTKSLIRHFKTSYLGCMAVFPTCRYLTDKYPSVKPIMFYDYEEWNPNRIKKSIMEALPWRIPDNVQEDWHSDCTFNVFKEYMFQKMLGVSYTDAHLSNQIRYGHITREEAKYKLAQSKIQFANALPEAVKQTGLSDVYNKLDPNCFEVDIV